ncbi:MAG: NADH-quinone oxidoreductase subunit D [Planctomycetota bacterium]
MASILDDQTVVEFDVRTDEMLINMGPQHPSTHGVLRLVLRSDGEVVSEITPHIGYLHRCAEKIGENVDPLQFIPYSDRMDYLAGMNMNLGYSVAVEKLMGIEIPQKAKYLRIIIAEMNRIASHLVGMGTYGLDLGSFSPFLYAFREREKILDLFEEVCGARLTYSYITIGGAHDDLPDGWLNRCQDFLEYFQPRIQEYHTLLTDNQIFIKRTANIGNLSPELAKSYGCSGPVLRGSGIDWDLRRDVPYLPYHEFDWKVAVAPFPNAPPESVLGDSWNRYYVRMMEVVQSVSLVLQAIEKYKSAEGSHRAELPRSMKIPVGEVYVETECPRGAMGFMVIGRDDPIPLRVRAKSSCFCNLACCSEISRGCLIADIPAIVGSLDIVMGEIDR